MAKSIYQKELDELLSSLEKSGKKPSLLLHACCGPCSSYVIEYLTGFFDITILYYNPNIYPQEEYERRLAELEAFLPRFSPAVLGKVKLVKDEYLPDHFYQAVGTDREPELAREPEKGERCRRCYEFRLKRAYQYAAAHEFDYFCTTLSISPFKDAEKINVIGECLASQGSPKWLPSDFKKKSGFLRSLQLSEEYGLYRQQYCGCVFSMQRD
ncbi:epoxyqueuosine reductase QueH [Treponema sp. C6A8]|uniref:epoxyqueuosine reductase QueH n=1 Tax=Treponema sp. C6A8 TaxID=1410609 RepID=UPI000480915A|nr:epoxyqueuosine reductase QueH [Treponema sp. C6A8]